MWLFQASASLKRKAILKIRQGAGARDTQVMCPFESAQLLKHVIVV